MKKLPAVMAILFFVFQNAFLDAAEPPKVPAEIVQKTYVYEVVRHLYRWYLDEIDIENATAEPKILLKIFALDPKLDSGDKSKYAEIVIPVFKVCVKLKKSDYRIDELNIDVKSGNFKIVNVSRVPNDYAIPGNATTVEIDIKEMKDYLFKLRNFAEFPNNEMFERIRRSLRDEIGMTEEFEAKLPASARTGDQIVHIAPLSPIVNEVWIFWENGRMLFRCASDIDLANQALWENSPLTFRIYDVYNQMVVSLDETAGDNSFLTRDQIGRALYNCVVLGKRLSVPKPERKLKK
ncbi:MAG: hypothetical protein WC637_09270 [Victivallales bacterium]|jgi:hypothetical protein